MNPRLCAWRASAGALLVVAATWPAAGQESPSAAPSEEREKKLNALIEESIGWYEVLPQAGAAPLAARPIARWQNASREQQGTAVMVVWTHAGRPEAVASIYPWRGELCHEFGSLSREATLVAQEGTSVLWSPQEAGVEFRDVPDAPAPAERPAERLRQMKSLAERFTAIMTGWASDDSDREQLRMQPRPLYRYEVPADERSNLKVQDGALFAFVQGTDPEVLLLLEAVQDDEVRRWQYGFARATSGGLEARLGDEVVWSQPKFSNRTTRSLPLLTVARPIVE